MAKSKGTIPSYTYEDTSDPNIKRIVDRKGDWTHYFKVKEKQYVKAVNWILALGFNKGPRFAAYLSKTTEEEALKKLMRAGDEGTRTHSAILDLIGGSRVTMTTKYASDLVGGRQESLNDEEWKNLQAFENWCVVYKPRLVAQDQTVAGENCAGTFDALLVISVPEKDKAFPEEARGKDVLILVDWKTSSGIWNEYKAQLAAYWDGICQGHKWDTFVKAFEGRVFSGILRIGTKHTSGYEFKVWDGLQTAKNIVLFMSAHQIANDHEPEWECAPDIEEIKTEFFVQVPLFKVKKPKAKRTKKSKPESKVDKQGVLLLSDNK